MDDDLKEDTRCAAECAAQMVAAQIQGKSYKVGEIIDLYKHLHEVVWDSLDAEVIK